MTNPEGFTIYTSIEPAGGRSPSMKYSTGRVDLDAVEAADISFGVIHDRAKRAPPSKAKRAYE
jgi:hypothetical protein